MTEAIAVHVSDRHLVALAPHELPAAQRQVADWCRAKIVALSLELREQRENLREARRMLWRNNGWVRAAKRTTQRMIYYAKIKKAVEAGYLIVPNFNVDVIAVRVDRYAPPQKTGHSAQPAEPELLPPGRGRYVDNQLTMRDDSYNEKKPDGSTRRVDHFTAVGYDDDVDFPVSLVKPAILQATDRAMAVRIFDRLGIVRASRRSDPIVVGQIIDPREKYWHQNPRCVSFFVAWWLDTKDL